MGQPETSRKIMPNLKWRRIKWLVQGLLVVALLYYPIGALTIAAIDDDVSFAPKPDQLVKGGSLAVAMAAALINRETRTHAWVANEPFFLPGSILDDMPNYQQGIISAVATFTFELKDQIDRLPGSSRIDPDLQEAAVLLQYSGKKWRWDLTASLWPVPPSEEQYIKAMHLLLTYNGKVAKGEALFGHGTDNLSTMLRSISLDMGSSAAALDQHIKNKSAKWLDTSADDLFYKVKGQAYGYAMILKALRSDYAKIVSERELGPAWSQLDDSLKSLSGLRPMVVTDGRPDGLLVANHLAAEGFYLLQAQNELHKITTILQK